MMQPLRQHIVSAIRQCAIWVRKCKSGSDLTLLGHMCDE